MTLVNSGIPLPQWSGADATNALRQTIIEFNAQSSKQTKTMIRLTYVIAGLTFVMTVAVIVQIWLMLTPKSA